MDRKPFVAKKWSWSLRRRTVVGAMGCGERWLRNQMRPGSRIPRRQMRDIWIMDEIMI